MHRKLRMILTEKPESPLSNLLQSNKARYFKLYKIPNQVMPKIEKLILDYTSKKNL